MEVKIFYRKEEAGDIKVTLNVASAGDYPTCHIFKSAGDYPTNEDFFLAEGNTNEIQNVLDTPAEARAWGATQVHAIKKRMQVWSNIQCPADEEIII